ncbi:MAG TPA: cytochrome c peroxidase [Myxococcota bacterium]|nr:cytochrome c peroxidase [Myxococcota bacterium]
MTGRQWLALSLWCVLGTAVAGRAAAQGVAQAPHGALAFAEQQKRIDKLGTGAADGSPPPRVAASAWADTIPKDNELSPARVALGRRLFFETRLSADGTVACATCHDVSRGFADQRPVSEGIRGQLGRRNAPTVMNATFFTSQFWDGRAPLLEDQAKLPIVNPIEMGMPSGDAAVANIAADASYTKMFQDAYGSAPNYADVGRAIASYERTLVFLDAPFDRWRDGDAKAMSADAVKGFALFQGKARCVSCHPINEASPIGSDNRFHNIGVSARHQDFEALAKRALDELAKSGDPEHAIDRLALETDMSELGRFVVTRNRSDIGAFKTQQLRNVGLTAPYMHDGSMQTLWDVVDHYNRGGEANPYLDGGIEPLALSAPEIDQLVAFLFALTDVRFAEQNRKIEAAQRARAKTTRPFRDEALAQRKQIPFEERIRGVQK